MARPRKTVDLERVTYLASTGHTLKEIAALENVSHDTLQRRFASMPAYRHKPGFRGPSPDVGKATQFRPGSSGNPNGVAKTMPLSAACREVLAKPIPGDPLHRTYGEAIAQMLAGKA